MKPRHKQNKQKEKSSKNSNEGKKVVQGAKEVLTATRLSTDGRAIARSDDGMIVFVKNMLPSEKGKVEIFHQKTSYKSAHLISLENKSPDREEPPCPYYGTCGGCQLQHMSQSAQTHYKSEWFFETLKRIGKWNEQSLKFVEKNLGLVYLKKFHYRRRIKVHFDGINLGFMASDSHQIVDIATCYIARQSLNEKLSDIRNILLQSHKEIITLKLSQKIRCEIELTESDDQKVVISLTELECDNLNQKAQCHAIFQKNLGLQADQTIHLSHPDVPRFKIKKQNFVQPHFDCMLSYYGHLKDHLAKYLQKIKSPKFKNTKLVAWDLYAGSGIFTSLPYHLSKEMNLSIDCTGVEGAKEAADSLAQNLKNLPIQCKNLSVEDFLEQEFQKKVKNVNKYEFADIVILDPPRTGVGIEAVQKLVEVCNKKSLIMFLACDPASFARDSRIFFQAGFTIKHLVLFDSFANTTHYEILGCFERLA